MSVDCVSQVFIKFIIIVQNTKHLQFKIIFYGTLLLILQKLKFISSAENLMHIT